MSNRDPDPPSDPDGRLTDSLEFEHLYEHHWGDVCRYIARRVADRSVAEDIASEVFARAFEFRRSFRGTTPQQERAWLFVIARNELSSHFRNLERERRAIDEAGLLAATSSGDGSELTDRLAKALGQLSPEHQQILLHRAVLGRGYETIASDFGISEGTARVRLSRALKALSEAIAEP